jgi:hypothetical protein
MDMATYDQPGLAVQYQMVKASASGVKPSKNFIQSSTGRGMYNQNRVFIDQRCKPVENPILSPSDP